MSELEFYRISALPGNGYDSGKIFDFIGRESFVLVYDLEQNASLIGLKKAGCSEAIERGIAGLRLSHCECRQLSELRNISAFSVYRLLGKQDNPLFYDLFDLAGKDGFLAVLFLYSEVDSTIHAKRYLEKILSSKTVHETDSFLREYFSSRINSSAQRDIYHSSEELLMLNKLLESMNNAVLGNGLAYNIFLLSCKGSGSILGYIRSHFLILNEYEFERADMCSVIELLSRKNSLPYGVDYSKEFLRFYGSCSVNRSLPTVTPKSGEGIQIGTFVKEGVAETGNAVDIDPATLNLGFVITGLPGSGKTREAMSIIDLILAQAGRKRPAVFIITPTEEWKGFASVHNMFFVKAYADSTPINFFRCPEGMDVKRFYGDLAMILASASNAGPYQNPMEKCMLNAFKVTFRDERNPDPTSVYDQIEESIIRYHGKRTNVGVRYTKHGENIKSSLEDLRGILSMPQYCVQNGINIEDFLEKGAVFDLSSASTNVKRHLYALILNQIYALASQLDLNGDGELRLLICIEEAQTIFGGIESPAVRDIKQRIQDFRKQGIAIMLLTHSVSDIEVGIRRLCQLKLYLKQAADTAQIASKDLIFGNAEPEEVALKLKLLDSGIGAFSYVSRNGAQKEQQESIFLKTNGYDIPICDGNLNTIDEYISRLGISAAKPIKCSIHLTLSNGLEVSAASLKGQYELSVSYLGEEVERIDMGRIDSSEITLLEGTNYEIGLRNGKGKTLKRFAIKASKNIYLDIRENA
ncbi:MAG: hypothetical protein ABSE71_05140 [Candidatus Micrarchaeaceae archaeon]